MFILLLQLLKSMMELCIIDKFDLFGMEFIVTIIIFLVVLISHPTVFFYV